MRARLVIDGPRDPLLNMALDEVMLAAAVRGRATVRVYQWLPSAVSLGRRQAMLSAVRLGEALARGFTVVRRPTGGGALLHGLGFELTYSVALPPSHPLTRAPVDESAARIAGGVAAALARLGLEASVAPARAPGDPVICMLNPGSSDVVARGRKVSGSAQLRRGGALLQHGSILLRLDAGLWLSILKSNRGVNDLLEHVAGVWDLGLEAGVEEIAGAVAEGIAGAAGLELEPSSWEPWELGEALALAASKYGQPGWSYPYARLPPAPRPPRP